MPRPIPDDVENVSGFIWYLIPIPDDPVFVQAAWDAFSELTYPWNWGKEGRVPESDIAAQLWADAIYEALRVRDMGFPDNLLAAVDEVEDLLRELQTVQACCEFIPGADSVTVPSEDDTTDSDTDIGAGTFPPGTTTETEARNYLCGAATAFVDRLIEAPAYITQTLSWGIAAITLLVIWYTAGALIAITGAAIVGGLISLNTLLDAIDLYSNLRDLIDDGTEPAPSVVETQLTNARDDLICSIVLSDTAEQAGALLRATIADNVTSIPWQNALFLLTANPFLARIFNGDSSAEPSTACTCVFDVDVTFTYDTDSEGFTATSGCQVDPPWNSGEACLTVHGNTVGNACAVRAHADDIRAKAGLSAPAGGLQPYIMTFDVWTDTTFNVNDDLEISVNGVVLETITGETLDTYKTGSKGSRSYTLLHIDPFSLDSGSVIAIQFLSDGGGGGSRSIRIDNLRFAGNGATLG